MKTITFCAALLLMATTVSAQQSTRGYVSVNGGYQTGSGSFSDTGHFPLHAEEASQRTDYSVPAGPTIDFGMGIRVWRRLAAGVEITRFSRGADAPIAVSLPHPFFFSQSRDIPAVVLGRREETGVHVQVAVLASSTERFEVVFSGGPSFMTVKQDLAQQITFIEDYPYDTATVQTSTRTQSKSVLGFNVGMDVGWYFSRAFGIGAVLGFSQGKAQLSGQGGELTVDVGGLRVGAGVRVRFH